MAARITRFVISSAQNDTRVNLPFFNTLKSFCKKNFAELILMPTKYVGHLTNVTWDEEFDPYLLTQERDIGKSIRLLGDLFLLPTIENPIGGFDVLSKGKTIIVGHPQYQMKSLPRPLSEAPIVLSSTGSVTEPNVNAQTKTGKKAVFNHSYSALYISVLDEGGPDEEFHIRALNWDGQGFYDIDGYYSQHRFRKLARIDALITGDEHVVEIDPEVDMCIYGNGGIVEKMKPKVIVRHDVFDAISISHHKKGMILKMNSHERHDKNDLQKELDETCDFIVNTTPKNSETWIVASNHNEHLDRWLQDPDSNLDKKNSRLYHWLMWKKMKPENEGVGAFELYFKAKYPDSSNIIFLDRDEPKLIHEIDVGMHGDRGANGSRGSPNQFARYTRKTISGHSHSPSVNKGAYIVGTSSKMKLEYTSGASSWMHTMCIIYDNGKRQLINVINGKWGI